MSKGYVSKTYRPAELVAVLTLLQNNKYHNFDESEAVAIVKMLQQQDYRIVKVGWST